jgi:hypothetical protein
MSRHKIVASKKRVPLCVTVAPETKQAIRDTAPPRGWGRLIDQMMAEWVQRSKQ